MVLLLALALGLGTSFGVQNKEFFGQVGKERAMGAEWHYVGKQSLDPTAKSIPGQIVIQTQENVTNLISFGN